MISILGQCKRTKHKIASKQIREFEAALSRSSTSLYKTIGLYVSTTEMASDAMALFYSLTAPMIFIQLALAAVIEMKGIWLNRSCQGLLPLLRIAPVHDLSATTSTKMVIMYDQKTIYSFSR
jgi:hypothetical protein